ncbi:MAG: sulfatase [Planctomycetota bacterium]
MRRNVSSFVYLIVWLAGSMGMAADPPNFIVFIADDMGWEDCGVYGNPAIRTPNIDALAAAGLRFDAATLTCSSCSPSRCSILTGRYPHSTGAGELHLPLAADRVLLTTPLRQAGYWTAAIGKWHLGDEVMDQFDLIKNSPAPQMGTNWVKTLRGRPKDKPFFLWAAHYDPHRAYQPGAVDPPHDAQQMRVPPYFPDHADVREDLALYADEVSRFDVHIGMVLQELERQDVADNTFLLVMSDNGRPFPHCKTRVNVPGVRTPFIVRYPRNVAAGKATSSVVSSVDIAPTILELAGLEPIDSFQGTSFAPVLADPSAATRQYAFAEHNWHDYRAFERGVHDDRFCYVRNWLPNTPATPPADAVRSPTYEVMKQLHQAGKLSTQQSDSFQLPRATEFLFDVQADPHCIDNLVDQPEHASVLAAMRTALSDWQTEYDDRFPGEDELTPDGFDRESGARIIKGRHPDLVGTK